MDSEPMYYIGFMTNYQGSSATTTSHQSTTAEPTSISVDTLETNIQQRNSHISVSSHCRRGRCHSWTVQSSRVSTGTRRTRVCNSSAVTVVALTCTRYQYSAGTSNAYHILPRLSLPQQAATMRCLSASQWTARDEVVLLVVVMIPSSLSHPLKSLSTYGSQQ